jgi:hypothetical protein
MLKKTIFSIAAIAATLGMMIGMTTVPYTQTAVAYKGGTPDDNANPVATGFGGGSGATSNQEGFQGCKQTRTASVCT